MKKILILTDKFYPDFAPRLGSLCKYLDKNRWSIYVLVPETGGNDMNFSALQNHLNINVTYIHISREESEAFDKKKRTFIYRLKSFFYPEKLELNHFLLLEYAKKIIEKEKIDLLFCSTSELFPFPAAVELSEACSLPLVADFRDIIEQNTMLKLYEWRIHWRKNRLLKYASAVTTISQWHQKYLGRRNKNTFLIYNGFDDQLFYPREHTANERLNITYTGTLDPVHRNPKPLFEALSLLVAEQLIEKIMVNFYIPRKMIPFINQLINKHKIPDNVVSFHDMVPFQDVPDVLKKADILLVLSGQSRLFPTRGIMTTKIFEYLAMQIPVMVVPRDNGCLDQFLAETGCGKSFGNAKEIFQYLKTAITQFSIDHSLPCEKKDFDVSFYTRKYQSKQFEELFDSVLRKQ